MTLEKNSSSFLLLFSATRHFCFDHYPFWLFWFFCTISLTPRRPCLHLQKMGGFTNSLKALLFFLQNPSNNGRSLSQTGLIQKPKTWMPNALFGKHFKIVCTCLSSWKKQTHQRCLGGSWYIWATGTRAAKREEEWSGLGCSSENSMVRSSGKKLNTHHFGQIHTCQQSGPP